jgi:hypothetical protein
MALWLLFTSTINASEAIGGIGASCVAATLAEVTRRHSALRFRPRLLALLRRRVVPSAVRRLAATATGPPIRAIRSIQSGHVGDYAAWFVLGVALLGGAFALAVR